MDAQTSTSADSHTLRVGRAVCLAGCGALVLGFAVAVVAWFVVRPADVAHNAWSTPEGRAVLADWGIPPAWWIAYLVVVMTASLVVCVVAAYLVLRAEVSWFRLYVAFALVLWGTVGSDLSLVVDAMLGPATAIGESLQGVGWLGLFMLAYVFPDGRFVPAWGRWFVAGWLAYFTVSIGLALVGGSLPSAVETVLLLVLFAGGMTAQVYRYVRVSGRLERQQTRWLLTSLILWLALAVLLALTPLGGLFDDASAAGLATYAVVMPITVAVLTLIPASVAVAILRHRLYDIDVWISRTILYLLLTVFVIGTYAAAVTVAGQVWDGGDTLALPIAAAVVALAFNPVRAWVQQRVNRLMYGDRDDPYSALSRLSGQLANVAEPEAIGPAIVETVSHALRVPYVAITMGSPEEVVASRGRPAPRLRVVRAATPPAAPRSSDRREPRPWGPVLCRGPPTAAGLRATQRRGALRGAGVVACPSHGSGPPTGAGEAGDQPGGGTSPDQPRPARLPRLRAGDPGDDHRRGTVSHGRRRGLGRHDAG